MDDCKAAAGLLCSNEQLDFAEGYLRLRKGEKLNVHNLIRK